MRSSSSSYVVSPLLSQVWSAHQNIEQQWLMWLWLASHSMATDRQYLSSQQKPQPQPAVTETAASVAIYTETVAVQRCLLRLAWLVSNPIVSIYTCSADDLAYINIYFIWILIEIILWCDVTVFDCESNKNTFRIYNFLLVPSTIL